MFIKLTRILPDKSIQVFVNTESIQWLQPIDESDRAKTIVYTGAEAEVLVTETVDEILCKINSNS